MAEPDLPAGESGHSRSFATVGRILSGLVMTVVVLAALLFGALLLLDSPAGHRFLVAQLPRLQLKTGLTVSAAKIDGSLFGELTVHDLQLGDPQGKFASAAVARLDWRPRDFLHNTLTIRSLTAPEVRLHRLPKLRPSGNPNILPDFDIFIGKLAVDRLVLEAPVTGEQRVVALRGTADIRSGRALVDLDATAAPVPGNPGGDTLHLLLDAEPDRDRFDIDASVKAPVGGVIGHLAGLTRPLEVRIAGDGKWSAWNGTATARLGGSALADLTLTAANGRFGVRGTAVPGLVLTGRPAALTAPRVTIDATATVADRRADVVLHAASDALRIDAAGKLDFAAERFDGFAVDVRVLQPAALDPRLQAQDLRLGLRLAGNFRQPLIDYTLTAPLLRWGTTTFAGVRAAGIADLRRTPLVVPVTATATRVTGLGGGADELLTNVRIDGAVTFQNGVISTDALNIRSDRLNGRATLRFDTASGALLAVLNGQVQRLAIPGLGVADIVTDVRTVTTPKGLQTTGSVRATMRQVDNASIRNLLAGLPVISADFDLAPDQTLALRNVRLTSPGLSLTGSGGRSAAGVINFAATGSSRDYGPVELKLAGPLDRLVVDLHLARPKLGAGVADVAVRLAAEPAGWSFAATAKSDFGPIAAHGLIHTSAKPLAIDLTEATAAGLTARGGIVQTAAGPFAGRIAVTGPGLTGHVDLSAAGSVQRADAVLAADHARLALTPPVTIGSGNLTATVLLEDAGPNVSAKLTLANLVRGATTVASAAAAVDYRAGHGTAKLNAAGYAGAAFTADGSASFTPDRIAVDAKGSFDGRRFGFDQPAVATRTATGWVLAPARFTTPEGSASISGSFGDATHLQLKLDRVGLGLLDIVNPALQLTGRVSGVVDVQLPGGGALPVGNAELRVNGLSRAGLGTAATRIDLGINAVFNAGGASAKMVIARAGKIEGRAQASVAAISTDLKRPLSERLLEAPLFGQLRWNGPAEALWQFAALETIDLRGPVTITADAGGTLGVPTLTGELTSDGGRIEGTSIGLVVDKIKLVSRFTQSRLEIVSFAGNAGAGGTVTATGAVDLSTARGIPIDISIDLRNAQVLGRDDLRARMTGAMHVQNDPFNGARVSGKLHVDQARVTVGGTTTADIPVLQVREINGGPRQQAQRQVKPTVWQLDLAVTADNRVVVTGMGLDSEWSANLVVRGSATAPVITGRVELVRGDFDFAGRRFSLTRGDIRFTGSQPIDPLINVNAENVSADLTATLAISGTASRPEIAFGSVPALPEDEVLSRVLFGQSVANLSAPEALQLAGALATLRGGGGGLNPIGAVRKGLGIDRLRILPADVATGRKTAVSAGRYIGNRTYVEIATDAQGYTATSIEFRLTRSLSILSQVATLGGTSFSVRWKRDY